MLAKKAFARTAAYDAAISNYLSNLDMAFPPILSLQFTHGRMLRYGENPHQQAAVYGTAGIAVQNRCRAGRCCKTITSMSMPAPPFCWNSRNLRP